MCGVISHLFLGLTGHIFDLQPIYHGICFNQVHASLVPGFLKLLLSLKSVCMCVSSPKVISNYSCKLNMC